MLRLSTSASSLIMALAAAGILQIAAASTAARTVVVTGATGRTGSLLYGRLKAKGLWNVRAFVRNATKAKSILGCSKCDESEGVFVGDLTDKASVAHVMKGADVLAITTASAPKCSGVPFGPFGHCSYAKGAEPRSIDWLATKAQVKAFAMAGGDPSAKQILYVSTMDTTVPNNFLDKIADGQTSFYHLQAEVSIMSAGIPFTIVKACGLGEGKAEQNKLIVGHDDASFSLVIDHQIQRDDVARVLAEAVLKPASAANLRFDLCSQYLGSPTEDIENDIFKQAKLPWGKRTSVETLIAV